MTTRICLMCDKEYQPTSNCQKYCLECRSVAVTEGNRASSTKWRKANPEKNRTYNAKWKKANPGKTRAYDGKWYRANPEKAKVKQAKWNEKNPAYLGKWCRANPEKRAVSDSKRRVSKYANTSLDEMLTSTEWLTILAEHNGHCHYCGKKAKPTLDHIIPLSKGGKHSKDNVVPACSYCNGSKGNKTIEEWAGSKAMYQWLAQTA